MHPQDIVLKTERGVAEITARALSLAPKLRRLLIMIDSTRSVNELEQIFAPLGNVREMLAELASVGLITFRPARAAQPFADAGAPAPMPASAAPSYPRAPEPTASRYAARNAEAEVPRTTFYAQAAQAAPAPLPPSRVAAFPTGLPVETAAAAAPAGDLLLIKSQVRAYLTSVLGSDESMIDAKLEAVADRNQLAGFLAGCENILSSYGGVRIAKEFRARFGAHYG